MDAKKVKTPKLSSKKSSDRKKNSTSKTKTTNLRSNSVERSHKNANKVPLPENNQTKKVILNETPSLLKDNKIGIKLDLIDKQLEKSEEIIFNQNKTLSKIKEIHGRINYMDKNFESIYYKNDIENFNVKLASNDENLMNILSSLKQYNSNSENLKNLQDQNRNLKYKLDIVEVEVKFISSKKDDKNLFYQNKLDTFEAQMGGEIHDLFNFLKNMNLSVPFNFPNINPRNMDENQIALFFAFLKQMIKALKYKYDEKEKDLKFIQYDKNNLLEELNLVKKRYENNNNINHYEPNKNLIHVEDGKNEEMSLNNTLNLNDNWRTYERREPKLQENDYTKNLNYSYSKKY